MTVEQDWIRPEGRALLVPGTLSPRRPVPASIERPEYVGKDEAVSDTGPFVQSADVIARVREASRVAALALQAAGEAAQPGVTTDHIDAVVHDVLLENGAYPSTLGYLGFEKSCCTSLNEVICHGIPDSTVMQSGTSSTSTSPLSCTASTATATRPSSSATSPRAPRSWSRSPTTRCCAGSRRLDPAARST